MSEDDYDAYNLSLDIEDIPYITSLPPSPPTTGNSSQETKTSQEETSQDSQSSEFDVYYTAPSTQIDGHHSDSYSDYDIDFTAEDFETIDKAVAAVAESSTSAQQRSDLLSNAGGPSVAVVLEEASKALSSMGPPEEPPQHEPPTTVAPRRKGKGLSPYDKFRSWRGTLSVTDLTGPSWCEVQFDYGLRQMRYKRVDERPAHFMSAAGKKISVDKTVAVVNDRVAQRGKSVHKVLERELHPEAVEVHIRTDEERWALRLVNMITSMQSLLHVGRCREMHVFGMLNSQVVVGIIDEVERRPIIPTLEPSPRGRKRSPSRYSAPSTLTKPTFKKARRSLSPSQLPLTDFLPSTLSRSESQTESQTDTCSSPILEDNSIRVSSPPHESSIILLPSKPPLLLPPQFSLHLSDTKTRRHPSLPATPDTFSARIQLMLYHRLLSNLLASPSESEDALDFQLLWTRMGLDHRQPFSKQFRESAGLALSSGDEDGSSISLGCLDDLTEAWRNVVEMLNVTGVDDTLTVVYRTQPVECERKGKKRQTSNPAEELIKRETDDIIRAVIASLSDNLPAGCDEKTIEGNFKTMLAEVMNAGVIPATDPVTDVSEADTDTTDDTALQWAIRQSLLEQVRKRPELKDIVISGGVDSSPPSPKGESIDGSDTEKDDTPAGTPESTIIGTKAFQMNDKTLNGYLKSVLNWWYGRRPPKGVEIHLTRRCISCEYQEGCEWREKKATEWRETKGR